MAGKCSTGAAGTFLSAGHRISARQAGQTAEQIAQRYLSQQGLIPVEHNVSFKTGELDLIMWQNNMLVFVEVRYRRSNRYGSAAESITAGKQKRLIQSATLYCQQRKIKAPWRIDVVTLTPETHQNQARSLHTQPTPPASSNPELRIDWLVNAISN